MIWLLTGCGVPMEDLSSGNLDVQERALQQLPTWQTRQVIPQLRSAATSTDLGIFRAALDGLVRADTDEAELVLRAHLVPPDRAFVLQALGAHHTKRSCDFLAEVWVSTTSEREQEILRYDLESISLSDGWPCFQSLAPYRESSFRAAELWEKAHATL